MPRCHYVPGEGVPVVSAFARVLRDAGRTGVLDAMRNLGERGRFGQRLRLRSGGSGFCRVAAGET